MLRLQLVALQIDEPHAPGADLDHPVVLDDHHLPGVLEEGGDVRGEEGLFVAAPDHQRGAPASADDHIRIGAPHHPQRQRAFGLVHDLADRFDQGEVGHVLDHVGDDFGVGVAAE